MDIALYGDQITISECLKEAKGREQMNEVQKTAWYEKTGLLVILLIVFFPAGLYGVWKNARFTTKTKGIITGVVAVVFIVAITSGGGEKGPVSKSASNAPPAAPNMEWVQEIANEISKLKGELAAAKKRIDEQQSKSVAFQIAGEVKDRDEGVIQIFGLSVPQNHDFTLVGACQQNCNLIIVNPMKDRDYGHHYGPALHYFKEKKYSKNAFGGQVPVFVFGGPPADLDKAINKYNALVDRINSLEDEQAKLKEAALSPEERDAKAARETLSRLQFVYKGQPTNMTQWVFEETGNVGQDFHYGWQSKKNPYGPGYVVGYATWASTSDPSKFFYGLWVVDGQKLIPVDTLAGVIARENPNLVSSAEGLRPEKDYVDLFR